METPDISNLKSLSLASFDGTPDHWRAIRARATYVVGTVHDEVLYASASVLSEEALMELTDGWAVETEEVLAAKSDKVKKPYGDVEYADPGFRDKKKRYPISSPKKIRAAWSYINQKKNADKYTSEQLSHIKSKIIAAWKKHIDPKGPPSADK